MEADVKVEGRSQKGVGRAVTTKKIRILALKMTEF